MKKKQEKYLQIFVMKIIFHTIFQKLQIIQIIITHKTMKVLTILKLKKQVMNLAKKL